MSSPRSLVTGATGYVGGRLVPQLLAAGHTVRVMVRDERKAQAHTWSDDVEIAVGDGTSDSDVRAAMQDVDVLYYLLHSIGTWHSASPMPPRTPASAASSTSAA
jgi:uncharacterized protein YbjT (DUF2867 family)